MLLSSWLDRLKSRTPRRSNSRSRRNLNSVAAQLESLEDRLLLSAANPLQLGSGPVLYNGHSPITAMTPYDGGVLTAFSEAGHHGYRVHWSPNGYDLGGTNPDSIRYDSYSKVTAMIEYDGGVLTAFSNVDGDPNLNRVHWSPNGHDLGDPDPSTIRYNGYSPVTAMTVYDEGVLAAFSNVDGDPNLHRVHWSSNGHDLGDPDPTTIRYQGKSPITAIIPYGGEVLTAFSNVDGDPTLHRVHLPGDPGDADNGFYTGPKTGIWADADSITGVVTITGTENADAISIGDSSDARLFIPGFGFPDSIPQADVTSIVVDSRGGNDHVINSTAIPLVAFGGEGDDTIQGGDAPDFLVGNAGNDVLAGGLGADTTIQEGGRILGYATPTGDNGKYSGPKFGIWADADSTSRVVTITGTDESDSIIITEFPDGRLFIPGFGFPDGIPASHVTSIVVDAGGGNDNIVNSTAIRMVAYGGEGDDTITGGNGNDLLFGNGGNDVLAGGKGSDSVIQDDNNIDIDIGNREVTIYGSAGNDRIVLTQGSTSGGTINIKNRDHLIAELSVDGFSPQQFVIHGYGSGDFIDLSGVRVPAIITGGDGNDTIFGSENGDFIYGDDGDDIINANSGNDELYGGPGYNTLIGGDGSDTFEDNSSCSEIHESVKGFSLNMSKKELSREIDGRVEVMKDVSCFHIEEGNLRITRTDGSQLNIFLDGDPAGWMKSLAIGFGAGDRSIVGPGSTNDNAFLTSRYGESAARSLLESVGLIRTPNSYGSGTLLSLGGNKYVLTADHVVKGVPSSEITFEIINPFETGLAAR